MRFVVSRLGSNPVRVHPRGASSYHSFRGSQALNYQQTKNLLGRTRTTRRRNALSSPAEPSGKAGSSSRSGRLPRNGPEPIDPKMSDFNGA